MFTKPYRWCLPIIWVSCCLSLSAQSSGQIAPLNPSSEKLEVAIPLHRRILQANQKLNRFQRGKGKQTDTASINPKPRHFLARNGKLHRSRAKAQRSTHGPSYPNWSPTSRE